MAWLGHEELTVVVLGETPPTLEDWTGFSAYVEHMHRPGQHAFLIFSAGGAPTAAHRTMLSSALRGSAPRMALVSDSAAARGAAVAISWFNPAIAAFEASDVDSALAHLDLPFHLRRKAMELAKICTADVEVTLPERGSDTKLVRLPKGARMRARS